MIYRGAVVIKGEIMCKTGLHIGGGDEVLEIGGLDKPVIRHPLSRRPYIPGSSLKGKMRSLLELALDKVDQVKEVQTRNGPRRNPEFGAVHRFGNQGAHCERENCPICRIFGAVGGTQASIGPARLIVRDATLVAIRVRDTERSVRDLERSDRPLTELKSENTINRIMATSDNLRQMERVPEGSIFQFEFVFRVFTGVGTVTDLDLIPKVVSGMQMLANDTLGGSGSRGYGQIEFRNVRVEAPEELVEARAKFEEALPAAWRPPAPEPTP